MNPMKIGIRAHALIGLMCAGMVFSTGCASIVSGSRQEISVNSNPSGALVRLNGVSSGETPVSLSVRRHSDCTVLIEKEGYEPYSLRLTQSVNEWVFGNCIFGGIIGFAIDVVSGAMFKFEPSVINATLRQQSNAPIPPANPVGVQGERTKNIADPASPPSSPDLREKLKQLKELRDEGLISDDEYNAKRNSLFEGF